MINTKDKALPVIALLVLLYLLVGDCFIFKLAALLFLSGYLYTSFIPSTRPVCRSDDCIVSPVMGEVKDISYEGERTRIVLETTMTDLSLVCAPVNGEFLPLRRDGAVLNTDNPLAQKLNQNLRYEIGDFSMTLIPSFFPVQNYITKDRYFIGDLIAKTVCGRVVIEANSLDVKVAIGDKVRPNATILAYR